MMKCRLMKKLKGEEYIDSLLSKECERRQQELASGMMVVHNYSKETRRSSRLAERKRKAASGNEKTAVTSGLPVSSVASSLWSSLCQELMKSDLVKRLRYTEVPRSPGGTPAINPSKAAISESTESLTWTGSVDSPELLRTLNQKFRNVRSPSPGQSVSDDASPSALSP